MAGNRFSGFVGQCTWWVAQNLPWVNNSAITGNAAQWLDSAQSHGFAISRYPVPGSVAVWGANRGGAAGAGHVAIVTNVVNGLPVVSEDNWPEGSGPRTRSVSATSAAGIIGYILPPGSSFSQTPSTPAQQGYVARFADQTNPSKDQSNNCATIGELAAKDYGATVIPGPVQGFFGWITQPCVVRRLVLYGAASAAILIGLRMAGQPEPSNVVIGAAEAPFKAGDKALKAAAVSA